jgi:hypothetical protein
MTLENFIGLVDKFVQKKSGISVHDLPDFCFVDFFEEDFSPEETRDAAKECADTILYDNGFDDGE